ncbi:MAG: ACT domain-containing protein [Thermodesulfobacteriota bacterium]
MEKKTQISVILTNAPGELAKLCDVLKAAGVNILAMSIQNAKDSVKELFNMREKTGRRIALAESYRGILKDSSDYSLIRLLVDKSDEAEKALLKANHLVDTEPVLVFRLVNQPGMLGRVVKRFGEAKVNIDYVYGSAMEDAKESIFVLHIAEADLAKVEKTLSDL